MRIPRFYCPELPLQNASVVLPPAAHRHAVQVLRLKVGAKIHLFDGKGLEFEASLNDVQKRQSSAQLLTQVTVDTESSIESTLIQGVSRGERMDYAIQKAVELGVNRVIPVMTARCNVNLSGERRTKKQMHWQGIIVSACEQSGRSVLPQLEEVDNLENILLRQDLGQGIVLDPMANQGFNALSQASSVSLLIGPEGGLTEEEINLAVNSGFNALRFGPRILRTETAAIAALAVIQSQWGDLGNG